MCPVFINLFQAESELWDRRLLVLVACEDCHTICSDCCKRPNGKCPTCGNDQVPVPIINKALMELIENYACILEVSPTEIEIEDCPFDTGELGDVFKAK